MARSKKFNHKYCCYYLAENQTGDHGIFILVKADMPNLTNLNLSKHDLIKWGIF